MLSKTIRFLLFLGVLINLTGCFLFQLNRMVGSGTGQLTSYKYNYSMKEVNFAIKNMFKKHPEYIPDSRFKNSMIHYYMDLSTPESRAINADSIQFHFYLKSTSGEDILYWTRFTYSDVKTDWTNIPCELSLRGFEKNFKGMNTEKDFGTFKSVRNTEEFKLFEKEILPKIQQALDELHTH